jgi:hypothetical protein
METLRTVIDVLCVLMIPLGIWGLVSWFKQRKYVPNEHEWLSVMSRNEWKTTEQLCTEMQTRKNTTSSFEQIVCDDLMDLEEEGLVESQALRRWPRSYGLPTYVYRLKRVRIRRLHITNTTPINFTPRNALHA